MSAMQTWEARRFDWSKAARQIAASIKAIGARAWKSPLIRPSYDMPWRALDERLLRDIGISPIEAEMARLEARMGVAATNVREGAGYQLPEALRLGKTEWKDRER
jgi:hypothetical protein